MIVLDVYMIYRFQVCQSKLYCDRLCDIAKHRIIIQTNQYIVIVLKLVIDTHTHTHVCLIPPAHLCLLEEVADFLHERSVVSPLDGELFLLEAEAAAAGLALPVHAAV